MKTIQSTKSNTSETYLFFHSEKLGEGGGTSNKSRNEPLGSKIKTLKMPIKKVFP